MSIQTTPSLAQSATLAEPIFPPDPPALTPCSFSECANGHTWPPRMAIVNCPGCGGPLLATVLQNCVICNEPCVRTTLRTEHITTQMGVSAACKGEPSGGERGSMVSQREFYKTVEAAGGPRHPLEAPMPSETPMPPREECDGALGETL